MPPKNVLGFRNVSTDRISWDFLSLKTEGRVMHRFSRIIHEKKSKCTYELTTIGVDTLTNMLLFETHAL